MMNKMLGVGQNPTFFLILVSLSVLLLTDHVHAQGDPIAESNQFPCFNSENYTSNSLFQTNLNILLRSLASNGSEHGFFNTSIGVTPDIVYGLVQCRGDIPEDFCRSCLKNSTAELIKRCPNRKMATLRYDQCLLRYSNVPFFTQVDNISRSEYNPAQVSDADAVRFNEQVQSLLTNVSEVAASSSNGFGYGNASYTASGTRTRVFGLVQCNEDISPSNCTSCVQSLISEISSCCDKRVGAKIFNEACYLRYEQGGFAVSPAPAPAPAPEPRQSEDRVDKNASVASRYSVSCSIFLFLSLLVTALQMQ